MRRELTALSAALFAVGGVAQAQSDEPLFPPNPKAGECYARVFVPDAYETYTETVMVEPELVTMKATEPEWAWVEERIIVEDASEKLEIIPARYEWVEENLLVKEAAEELIVTPAEYDTVEETIIVQPAYTAWKKGRGLIERIDSATGEIMCRVEVPAEYKTIKKRVLTKPARSETIVIPAQYKRVKKRVMVEPPRTIKTTIPAKTKTVRVQKLARAAKTVRDATPAKFAQVSKTRRVAEGQLEWRSVLCETNAGPTLVTDIQRALSKAGYNPGPIDGVIGGQTMEAVTTFQQAKGLPTGQLTIETIRALGVQASF